MRWLLRRYFPDWGPVLLRLALGMILAAHGWEKLHGPLGTPEGFNIESWGWPYPLLWAYVVAIVEFFGGLLLVVGLFARFAATFVICVIVVAITKVTLTTGFIGGFELELALLAIAVSLVFTGAGALSIDRDILGWGAPGTRREDEL
jgi:uncharacterized membrane protein YphA (DoxX/SURF4 family)